MTGSPMLSLIHGGADPASLKLRFVLAELGLACRETRLDLGALEQWSDAHRAVSPQGRVPVLIDRDEVMTDAGIALLYLAESYGQSRLLPGDAVDWYAAQASNDTLDTQMLQAVNALAWLDQSSDQSRGDYLARLGAVPGRETVAGWSAVWSDAQAHDDQRAQAREKIAQCSQRIEAVLATRAWLAGRAFSVADISAYGLLHALPRLTPDLVNASVTPHLLDWLARIADRPAIGGILAQAAEDTAFSPPQ